MATDDPVTLGLSQEELKVLQDFVRNVAATRRVFRMLAIAAGFCAPIAAALYYVWALAHPGVKP